MALLEQIYKSNLSKKGRTNPTGVFEGTPQNVALVARDARTPITSPAIPPIQNPTDVTFNSLSQPTYLDFLKSSPTR
jgi:hypothetical protein